MKVVFAALVGIWTVLGLSGGALTIDRGFKNWEGLTKRTRFLILLHSAAWLASSLIVAYILICGDATCFAPSRAVSYTFLAGWFLNTILVFFIAREM